MEEAWEKCERVDWMLWACNKTGIQVEYGKIAAKFVREIWHLLKDERSKATIISIERGEVTYGIRIAARDARKKQADIVRQSIPNPFHKLNE